MTTASKDLSNYAGQPVVLYEFSRHSKSVLTGAEVTSYWRYTSSDRDWTDGDGHVYTAIAISDDGVKQSGDTTMDQLTITMPYTAEIPQMFTGSPPSDPITAIIRKADVNESDYLIAWAGLVGMVSRSQEVTSGGSQVGSQAGPANAAAQVVCNTVGATMDRVGLRISWSRGCPHDLYGFECRADPTKFVVTGPITALTGDTISVDAAGTISDLNTGTAGPIDHVSIANGGTTYSVGDTGTIYRVGAQDATYTVDAVNNPVSGVVTQISFTPGTLYESTLGNATTDATGAGFGLTLNIFVTNPTTAYTLLGGFIEWVDEWGHYSKMGIVGHTGDTVTLLGTTDKLTVGTEVALFLGCDRTRPTCTHVFNNLPNHGGHDYLPQQNPFNGDLIF